MISYKGYDDAIKRIYDTNNEHVFSFWEELNDPEKTGLLEQLTDVDFTVLKKLYSEKSIDSHLDFGPAPYVAVPKTDEEKKAYASARQIGLEHIKAGKTAAFLVAGGQGSRLGYEGPKGKFPVAPVSHKTLFQIHGEKIFKYCDKYGVTIPWLIMTSHANHDETVSYFEEMAFFNLNQDSVKIFPQNMVPSLDSNGKLILETKCSIFKNPDGHGGSLTALYTSGSLAYLKAQGIDTISYFQVDNPLVKIIDPVFIGFHVKNKAHISSKAVQKAYPEEKVGVFVKFSNERIGVMEYSDLTHEQTLAKNHNGDILFSSGSIAIHLFDRAFVDEITHGTNISLPFHTAKKKIKSFTKNGQQEIDGFKFEKFVFDALPLTEKNIVFETLREEEFAPVKNASGVDSVETSQELMSNLHKKWLMDKGISIPASVKIVEISPLKAVEADDLDAGVNVPGGERVCVE